MKILNKLGQALKKGGQFLVERFGGDVIESITDRAIDQATQQAATKAKGAVRRVTRKPR